MNMLFNYEFLSFPRHQFTSLLPYFLLLENIKKNYNNREKGLVSKVKKDEG